MNYNKKSVEDIDVAGKRVLCRCDFNVPTKDGKITSDKRIVAALPTIQYLVKHNARVILCSHMGKPKGEVKPELSLQVVADHCRLRRVPSCFFRPLSGRLQLYRKRDRQAQKGRAAPFVYQERPARTQADRKRQTAAASKISG